MKDAIEAAASGIELLAVTVIVLSVLFGTGRFIVHARQHAKDAYEQYRVHLAKALLLGLEFLVAADIVRTVALEATLLSVGILALLVVVRTFLSWSLVVEIEGRWPWRGADEPRRRS